MTLILGYIIFNQVFSPIEDNVNIIEFYRETESFILMSDLICLSNY